MSATIMITEPGRLVEPGTTVLEAARGAGIDIPTDGEIAREDYIHYHCRHIAGIDFNTLTRKDVRGGTYKAELPSITGPVSARAPFLPRDWGCAQAFTDRPVKITMPGPMTIADTTVNLHYDDERALASRTDAVSWALRWATCQRT